jgi:hypothetical protein
MKKFTLGICWMLASLASFSQQTGSLDAVTREDYLVKSKTQRVAGFIFLGAGVVTLLLLSPGRSSLNTTATVGLIAIGSTLVSIPLFIAAARNKRKARKIYAGIDLENSLPLTMVTPRFPISPGISLKLRL